MNIGDCSAKTAFRTTNDTWREICRATTWHTQAAIRRDRYAVEELWDAPFLRRAVLFSGRRHPHSADIRLAPRVRCKAAIRALAYAKGHMHVKPDRLMQGFLHVASLQTVMLLFS